ncbi:MAG TPA: hypothetical protein PK156_20860 [Polyangium sp.]|nr:hypothetical protein [Polyangium sp.]
MVKFHPACLLLWPRVNYHVSPKNDTPIYLYASPPKPNQLSIERSPTTRSSCPLILAHTLLGNIAMIEDSPQSTTVKERPNGQSSVRLVRQIKHADDQLVTLVARNPLAALTLALAVGYVLGRVVSRHA